MPTHPPSFGGWVGPPLLRQKLIVAFVFVHFAMGSFLAIPSHYLIRQLPVLSDVAHYYDLLMGFDQGWLMFSPPPNVNRILNYATITKKGCGVLVDPFSEVRKEMQHSLIVPRGATRLLTFLRSSSKDLSLAESKMRQFYFQQFSNYYCFGDGKISGLKKIRFYLVTEGMAQFYNKDQYGRSLPEASDYDSVIPIYERDCSEL